MKSVNVAVVGATGAVGQEMVKILEERKFPVAELRPLASQRSEGKSVRFSGEEIPVSILNKDSFKGIQIALFSAGAVVSKEYAPIAVESGAVVVDNTSYFRMEPDVPLVVPEVNAHKIKEHKGIIANPNCSTIQMVVALKPLHDAARIKRIVVSTYQSVSGAGAQKIQKLIDQTKETLKSASVPNQSWKRYRAKESPHFAFNLIPQIDVFMDGGYTKEEIKMIQETQKIMGDENIKVTATCVRVPVLCAHSESVNIETGKKLTAEQARRILSNAAGIKVVDDPSQLQYPMPINAGGEDPVFVGRIREDHTIDNGLNLWIVSDNLRKGAALNAV
ncbi:MAG: aspartate-semialdehyde dehydrogenase, partial [Candidatus Omnitrophica bacterium]|nr:aspartate-semialdehyde dehydrogenase [Candidatus Omnitrophota bacterium]